MTYTASHRRRLGEILVAEGVLTAAQLHEALAEQVASDDRERLGTTVVRLGLAAEGDVAAALAAQLGLEQVDLTRVVPDPQAIERVPRALATRHLILPLQLEDGVLTVAASDPTNVVARDDLRTAAGVDTVRMQVATDRGIREAVRRAYGTDQSALDALLEDETVPTVEEQVEAEELTELPISEDHPIVRLTNLILAEAVHARASDVHIEPGRNHVRVRYRVDGLLREVMRVPRDASGALASRLKIMARLDIAERRRPQDGRAVVRVDGREVDVRLSTLPTLFGETVVLRLLHEGAERVSVGELGMTGDQLASFLEALQRPQGLVVLTGPTGSGKTTTLYAGLAEMSDPVRNVVTLEDPIEYQLEGVNQTQIHEKVGLTFARGLRTLLRQDPDVVLVGEIRDQETAQLALQASFTGHLVLTTLHTNDAPSSIVRLVDLGVEPFLVASSLLLVVSQRLVRLVCEHCAEPTTADPRIVRQLQVSERELAGAALRRGRGCELCGRTGYRGREAVFEVLPVTAPLRELLMSGASETSLARLARAEGMRTLREDGIRKALEGRTTLEEILRVTPPESLVVQRCPGCAQQVGEGFLVCPSCGSDLATAACRACGRSVEPGWNLCPYCRASLPAPESAPAPRGVDIVTPTPDVDGEHGSDRRPTLLIVDDDESVLRLIGLQLGDDYDLLEAREGEEALALAHEHRPDAIVLDLRLPDLDGIEVTRRLRAAETTRWIPILMLTGVEDARQEVESLVAGVDDYLRKPFDDEVLRGRLLAARRRQVDRPTVAAAPQPETVAPRSPSDRGFVGPSPPG
ncbi:MAG TPA: ATPase, T2SS/T4P/T4SS family [Nitriliruptorales bacterium]|nr:ATPase, T2SS/T4P/T4SS family [Nitriliruptorales bacterium]